MSAKTPPGWTLTTLGEIAQWGSGGTPSRQNPSYYCGEIPWIKTGELGPKVIRTAEEHISRTAVENSSAKVFAKGSVGIAMYGATIGKTSIWGLEAATNQACAVATCPQDLLFNEFLYYFLISQQRGFINSGKGGAQPNISQSIIKDWPIALPPKSEQHRIVAKIEELFSELDKGVESLTTAREQLKAYRQAVLKHAFEGKLTVDWRASNPEREDGASIRQRLLQIRRGRWETEELERLKQQGSPPSSDKWKERYPEPAALGERDMPPLTGGWVWASLDELVSGSFRSMQSGPFGSSLLHSEFQSSGVLVLGIDNVRDGSFSMGNENRISVAKFKALDKYQARPGDLLITVMASLGRTCIVPRNLETAIITKHVYRISMEESLCCPEFYNLLLQTQSVSRLRMLENAQGQTRAGLNSAILKAIPVPVCPLAEQVEIVSRMSTQLSHIDATIAEIDEQIERSTFLRQSILRKAFSGQLVPQDPNDEPASVLLERIKAEKERSAVTKQKPKKLKAQGAAA